LYICIFVVGFKKGKKKEKKGKKKEKKEKKKMEKR
jgi:hypothetical protein